MERNWPIPMEEGDEDNVKSLQDSIPVILRVIKDLAEERKERLEELIETAKDIMEGLDI